jgi:tetratricopeptide (TPR) repeat protein
VQLINPTPEAAGVLSVPAASYNPSMSIDSDLARARRLIFAADEVAAKELLLSLGEQIEQLDRDELLLEVFAQLGEIYLVRTAYNGVEECLRRMTDCLAQVTMSDADIDHMICRYSRRAQFLRTGLAAAIGDHETAEAGLLVLTDDTAEEFPDLAAEHAFLVTYARILCAVALCDDDLHVRSVPLWEQVIDAIGHTVDGSDFNDFLLVVGATGYGRFCVETGRLAEAEPWLQRAGARAKKHGWKLAMARTQLERATAAWAAGDRAECQRLAHEAYPAIAEGYRAHDVSRSWLYFGLLSLSIEALDDADERFGHAEKHWREVEKPLHIHRILLQRSWINIFRGEFDLARQRVAQAKELLDSWPRHSWLQYARLDDHMGNIWRAEALADPANAAANLERAAELKVPAALAVDSIRHSMTDADARMRWATHVSSRILAGAFAVAWEWGNTELLSELIEYHSARGSFSTEPDARPADWTETATATVPVDTVDDYALVAGGSSSSRDAALTRLGPLPALQMDPTTAPIMSRYRALAVERYGCDVTADEPAWSTWP